MKKLLALILAGVMALSMVSCGNNSSSGSEPSDDSSQTVTVDENLLSVEITLPASFWENSDETVEEYADRMKSEGTFKDVNLNEDGSVTVKMSKADHKKMLDEIKDQITTMFPDEAFASIKRLEINDDVTDCKLFVDQAAFKNSFDGLAVLGVAISTQMYHVFEGEPDAVTVIHYIDEVSGTEFDTLNVPEDIENMGN